MVFTRFYIKTKVYMFSIVFILGVFTLIRFNRDRKGGWDENYNNYSVSIVHTAQQIFQNGSNVKSENNKTQWLKENIAKEIHVLSHIYFDTIEKDQSSLYTVIILISSFVDHKNRRKKIRESWGNPKKWNTNDKFIIVFVTGKVESATSMIELAEEAKVSKDIISLDIPEDFYLLAKKVIVGFTWAKHNIKYKAILKSDDDTFINIDNAINFINQNNETYGYFGQSMDNQPVERDGRYKLTKEEHGKNVFDPYCSGGGFIFTNASVYKIIPLFDLDKILRIDDAHIGELAFSIGIFSKMTSGFYMWNDRCEYLKDVIVSHPADDPECIDFLLKRSMMDNGKTPRDPLVEKKKYYKDVSLLS